MNWEDFLAGKISVYCGGPTEAVRFLNDCDMHGIPTEHQRGLLCKYANLHAYRWDGNMLVLYPCDNEGEWNGQLGRGNVTEVLRYADIQSKSIQIDTLDGLL